MWDGVENGAADQSILYLVECLTAHRVVAVIL